MWSSILRFPLLLVIFSFAPNKVAACEGECITGITGAFFRNYTVPVHSVLSKLANDIVAEVLPNRQHISPPLSIVQPIYSAYQQQAYTNLETDIFPSYFHGKCARKDPNNPDAPAADPPGCPNPNCPVVCGTPGSLVHFYSKLRYIAFSSTQKVLKRCAENAKEEVKKNVQKELDAGGGVKRRASSEAGLYHSKSTRGPKYRRKADHAMKTVERLLGEIPSRLKSVCAGTESKTGKLPNCSWEVEMKEYILSFP